MAAQALHERAESLRASRVPFVHARVVLAERPTSAKPGDEALVLADGVIEGFVGGTCAESTVRLQALGLLSSGDSMLLRITPEPENDQPGKTVVHNPCLSGGTLEIFLEPVLPLPLVAVLGDEPDRGGDDRRRPGTRLRGRDVRRCRPHRRRRRRGRHARQARGGDARRRRPHGRAVRRSHREPEARRRGRGLPRARRRGEGPHPLPRRPRHRCAHPAGDRAVACSRRW